MAAVGSSGLPLSKESPIRQALGVARATIRERLFRSMEQYYKTLASASNRLETSNPNFMHNDEEFRKLVVDSIGDFDQCRAQAHVLFTAAVEKYDQDMHELKAWIEASDAKERLVGAE